MRVLHLPENISNQINVTVRALRDIGVDARGIAVHNSRFSEKKYAKIIKKVSCQNNLFRGFINKIYLLYTLQFAIRWADIIHWHYYSDVLPKKLDLKYIKFLNKPRIVEFWGSDIRIPEIAAQDNPYFAKLISDPDNDYLISYQGSRSTQKRFAQYGFDCLIPCDELLPYVQRDLFPSPFRTSARLTISEFDPKYPDPNKSTPILVHTPTRLKVKGTSHVTNAVEQLKTRYNFQFKLIHDVVQDEAQAVMRDCDIMIDQLVLGAHGLAALEAMAFGKPTLCFIKPSLIKTYPAGFPIINANPDNLVEVLASLLENGKLRNQIGRQSRAYVAKYHDSHKIAQDLVKIYRKMIGKNSKKIYDHL